MNKSMKQIDVMSKDMIFYIFSKYEGEKLFNKIKRVFRNIKYFMIIKKNHFSNITYNCKVCGKSVDVYLTDSNVVALWGTPNPMGLCEKCIVAQDS